MIKAGILNSIGKKEKTQKGVKTMVNIQYAFLLFLTFLNMFGIRNKNCNTDMVLNVCKGDIKIIILQTI